MRNLHWRAVSGGLFAIYGSARAILDFIGYVDLVIAHRNSPTETWLGKLMDALLAPPIWTVFLFVPVGIALIWWDLRRSHPFPSGSQEAVPLALSRLRQSMRDRLRDIPQGPTTYAPQRDISLQDAACYAKTGKWPAADEIVFKDTGDINLVSSFLQRARELAGEGAFLIWGKREPLSLFELISREYWVDHQIDLLTLMSNPVDQTKTEPISHSASPKVFHELMANKAQVRAFWPKTP